LGRDKEREKEREREREVEKREKRSVISVTRTQSGSFGPDCCWGNNLTKLKKGVEIETERERERRERELRKVLARQWENRGLKS
jgi:hypothetical protein